MPRNRKSVASTELCAKCGAPLYGRAHPALRLCPRHAREHLASLPPFACTAEDMGFSDRCDECGHPLSAHDPRSGCRTLTARLVTSYGSLVEDTGPRACGCRVSPRTYE